MGLGKTIVTLTSIAHLLSAGFLRGVLIAAPIRVCRLVWRQEAAKWAHTQGLTFSMVVGDRDQRTRALMRPADIYLINHENLDWLAKTLATYFISKGRPLPFNGIVWDEISKMKNSTTNRVKSYIRIEDYFDWTTGLTGTPASNGYKDLHGQFLVIDKGARLGRTKTQFKTKFFYKIGPYKEVAFPDTETTIKTLIGDITLEMSAEDYNPLPDLIVNDVEVEMDGPLRDKYEQMERELFLHLDESGKDIEIFNQAALMNKCLAEGTEVLTYDGWKRIENVTRHDKVWDGVDWVSVSGVVYNGYKHVVNCWGVEMTPDHKVLTESGWREAQEVLNGEPSEGLDRTAVRTPYGADEAGEPGNVWHVSAGVVAGSVRLWQRIGDAGSKPAEQASHQTEVLRVSARGNNINSRNDKNSPVDDLAQYAIPLLQSIRQGLAQLRWPWNNSVSRMGRVIREVLGRYESDLRAASDYRANRREWGLLQGKLQMGDQAGAGEQYPIQRDSSDILGSDDHCTSVENIRFETNNPVQAIREGADWNGSNQAHVYDIINAGPRHRFTVRGKNGEVFIAHNCLQYGNGAVYPVAGLPVWEPIHDLKLDALEDILEEAQGQPILCAYAFKSDAERIMERFKHLNPINLTECKSERALQSAMDRWKRGDCALMIGHPASMGHGIDGLQDTGRHLVWYGLNWSLDLYEQFNARIRRQGQGASVVCHRIMITDTLDQAQALALDEKATTQAGLRKAVKDYRTTKGV